MWEQIYGCGNKQNGCGNKKIWEQKKYGNKKTMVVRTKSMIVGTNLWLWEQNNYQ
jgi:hypothetical protein